VRGRRSAIFLISFLALGAVANSAPAPRCEAIASPVESSIDAQALKVGGRADLGPYREVGSSAYDEMLRGEHETPLRWDRVPELLVLTSVMQYEQGRGTQYRATSQQLSDEEATQLVSDLTDALLVLTDHTFTAFASVRRESVSAGELVNVMRPGQIVVARYVGVRDQLATIGFGGRSTRGSTIRAGSIILDNDFDRADDTRGLLRMHELGHALGYNHVLSRPSIMNPKIGPGPTNVDLAIARVAFQGFPPTASSCS